MYYLCIRFIFLSSQNVITVSHNMQVAASKTAPLINIIFWDKFLSLMEMVLLYITIIKYISSDYKLTFHHFFKLRITILQNRAWKLH